MQCTTATVTCGVPKGSILGSIYVNDILSAIKCKLLLYADDSAFIVPGNNTKEIQYELSNKLELIREWLIDNKLSFHLGKTESILFASKTNHHKTTPFRSNVQRHALSCHVERRSNAYKIISKPNSKVKFLYRQTSDINLENIKILTAALIQCHFDYASSSWNSGLTKKYKAS